MKSQKSMLNELKESFCQDISNPTKYPDKTLEIAYIDGIYKLSKLQTTLN